MEREGAIDLLPEMTRLDSDTRFTAKDDLTHPTFKIFVCLSVFPLLLLFTLPSFALFPSPSLLPSV